MSNIAPQKPVYKAKIRRRKAEIRRQWSCSEKAGNMGVFEFGQFLIALEDAKTQEALQELENQWSKR